MGILRGAALSLLALGAILFTASCSSDVRIGAIVSESGGVKDYGKMVRRGIELAHDEVTAEGGMNGRPVQLLFRDDQSTPRVGLDVFEDLTRNEGVRVLIGAVASPVTLAIGPKAQEAKVTLLSPSSSAPKITSFGEYVFRNYPSDILEGTVMADFAKEVGVKKVAVLEVANEWGEGLSQVFTRRFDGGRRQAQKFQIQEGQTSGFEEIIEALTDDKPDGIYLIGYSEEMSALLPLLTEACPGVVLMATSSFTDAIIARTGDAAENLVFPQTTFDVTSDDPNVSAFVEAFRAKYDMDPDVFAAHGYDALKLIVRVMREQDSDHPANVMSGLLGTEDYDGAAGPTSFDSNGDVTRYPRLSIIRDGAAVSYEAFLEEGGQLPVRGK